MIRVERALRKFRRMSVSAISSRCTDPSAISAATDSDTSSILKGRMPPDQPREYPSELPVLALRDTVVFPLTLQPIAITRPMSIESVNRALAGDRLLFLTLQATDDEEPQPDQLKKIGTIAAIRQMAKVPNGGIHVVVEGLARARADVMTLSGQVLRASVKPAPEQIERSIEADAYVRRIHDLIGRALSERSGLSQELRGMVTGIDDPLRLAYLLSSLLDLKAEEKQQILEHDALIPKLQAVATSLNREIALLELKGKIETAAQEEMTDAQRQYFLRQQLKAIQDELGEGEKPEAQELRSRVEAANLPEAVHRVATREIDRLERMTPASPEYQMIRTYIDWVLDVPWATITEDRLDPIGGAQGSRRGPLRPGQGQGADRRIPRGPEAEVTADRRGVVEGADPVLRRAARRRQDVARTVDCPGDESQVRPDLARRRARRSRDPRAPADLYRRHSRPHRSGAQAGGRDEPGVHARRDRQDQRGLPG